MESKPKSKQKSRQKQDLGPGGEQPAAHRLKVANLPAELSAAAALTTWKALFMVSGCCALHSGTSSS